MAAPWLFIGNVCISSIVVYQCYMYDDVEHVLDSRREFCLWQIFAKLLEIITFYFLQIVHMSKRFGCPKI